jgi:hypothetical protein
LTHERGGACDDLTMPYLHFPIALPFPGVLTRTFSFVPDAQALSRSRCCSRWVVTVV